MPSKIEDDKEIKPQEFNHSTELTPLTPATAAGKDSLLSLTIPEDYLTEDEQDFNEEEERWFDTEEDFYLKLPRKFISRGYKRPENNLRAETRRKYQHFRMQRKEKKRKTEKFIYDFVPLIQTPSSPVESSTSIPPRSSHLAPSSTPSQPPDVSTASGSILVNPSSTGSCIPSSTDPASTFLSLKEEREYQEAVRQSSVQLAPTTGLSLQQILDMCNRDLTPEDYELLLRLDESLEKKTVKKETLTTLTEKTIDEEVQRMELCTVCMFNYELGDKVKYLPCGHYFHVDCIVPYLSSYGQNCPVCKAKV